MLQRTFGDDDDRLVWRAPGGEGIDAILAVQHVHRRRRQARGDRHLVHHVDQAALGVDAAAARHATAGKQQRELALADREARHDLEAAERDDAQRGRGHRRIDFPRRRRVGPPHIERHHEEVGAGDDQRHGQCIEDEQARGRAPGAVLLLEESQAT
jgi:hypothetical protein